MNKADLIDKMATEASISKAAAEKALGALTDGIKTALQKGEPVTLIGFGTYSVTERKARTGRNPQTGEELQIPAKKAIKFKAGKGLRDAVE
ncbi:MAG: HU family DNA-binding protein [bacterium]